MSLILHSGGKSVTRAQVEAVPVPEYTDSWRPVPYKDAVNYTLEKIDSLLGLTPTREEYGLNRGGNQLFAAFAYQTDDPLTNLSIGLRQSYDKSLSLGIVAGASVLVCDNLCFSGDSLKIVRKNTVNVWGDFKSLVDESIADSYTSYEDMLKDSEKMRDIDCTLDEGYEVLGIAVGREVLAPNQASVAFKDWRNPRHVEFTDRTMWSLYNCVTEGLKKGTPGNRISRQTEFHNFFMGEIA